MFNGFKHAARLALRVGVLAAVAVGVAPASAQAYTVDFEDSTLPNIYGGFELLRLGSFNFWFQSDGGLIGTVDDLDPAIAPTGNATQFALALNTGVLSFWQDDLVPFQLLSFDMAYVPHPNAPPLDRELVLVVDSLEPEPLVFGLSGNEGNNPFVHIGAPDVFRQTTSLNMFVCDFDPVTRVVCENGIVSGQFAIDNLVFARSQDIPEPASWALSGLALALLTGATRHQARRRSAAA